ncbi:hypothetical protein N0O92_15990 [Alkalihalobacillus sp. MEB130]|uniref:YqgU-like beta propeller domain-containing protein n=1 Tax=Alkalihalobacillus sp. MEB130 TaxID=2976704 RepID=UPI0028DD802A|nr:hypothetical protein [Alkalihalobacillus sp. MEB130]MDT8861719.1 hypothetical protein [Alkalihalobacillus sp. MEB130]
MKRILLYIATLLIVSSCTQAPLESKPLPKRFEEQPIKRDVPNAFFTGSTIAPIQNEVAITEVVGWFDDNRVLYLVEQEEQSNLYLYHLLTGETTSFLEVEGWIMDVRPNADYSLFAFQHVTLENETHLVVMNDRGEILQTIKDYGEEYVIYWNPYDLGTFIMVAYLPDWEFDTYVVNVADAKIKDIFLEQSYIQWISANQVGYLKWEELEPHFQAPLYEVNVDSGDMKKWKDAVIAYMSFPDELSLSVTVETVYDLYSTYTFYKEQEPYRQIEMPILNTYSEQWWIPFYSYDDKHGIFYYLRPKYSSDFFSYTDGYELFAYNVEADAEERLTTVERQVPISISPEGSFLLVGERLGNVIDIKEGTLVPLLEE